MNNFFKQFGGTVTKELLKQYEQSEYWENGSFQNLELTSVSGNLIDLPKIIFKCNNFFQQKFYLL